ncbi:Holliday junction branch migration protein RuvA [Nonomuraea glycinis]|uniref:Holliday junction branch migration complex subunit RuvA n=1 Tax=Nonomuraea glycinis TaxID=2047744 RepID=A0A918E9V8_9ACTN|nr:Holliday junction branch migration protein RuvA [Nonomuraea glycinis]MCA2181926.1 Holliday junction branch migration protein RuvA [Nonomuraea glycinis]WSG66757.1 Holliday junction branch migration protein RuvA [Nonomuraea glycinis]GGP15868.1 Holliday junction ATP-dependent DNA helicase RuvA [Nonomuraea glycinis]
MIASVTGRVAAIAPDGVVVEVGGVGLLTHCTPGTLATLKVGEQARLATSLVVREESLTLYGFATDDERTVFELLQTASGVGPKLALAMLAVHSPQALRVAVAAADLKALTRVPGIGQKGAQRIVLELKDRLGTPEEAVNAALNGGRRVALWRDQVHSGLVGLGYSAKDADEAIAEVEPEAEADLAAGRQPQVASLLKSALRALSVR